MSLGVLFLSNETVVVVWHAELAGKLQLFF